MNSTSFGVGVQTKSTDMPQTTGAPVRWFHLRWKGNSPRMPFVESNPLYAADDPEVKKIGEPML